MRWRLGAYALSLLVLIAPRSQAAAGEWDRNGLDSDDLATLQRRDPAFADALLQGEAELRAGAVARAAKTFQQLSAKAPESALTLRRYCQALTELGDRRS